MHMSTLISLTYLLNLDLSFIRAVTAPFKMSDTNLVTCMLALVCHLRSVQ